MRSVRVLRTICGIEHAGLVALFLVQGAALGTWLVPLSPVLVAHGLGRIVPYAFASTALAALVSPLIFGAIADRHASPVRVLRCLSMATGLAMILATTAIRLGWNAWAVLGLIQIQALCLSPTASIAATIAFSRLANAGTQFGPLRAMATLGWMSGCWLVSALKADDSTVAGYWGAGLWFLLAIVTFLLPVQEKLSSGALLTWHERLGLDALTLLKNRDHRVVFVMTALFCVPLAAFYPYAPPHLRELGFQRTSAWMSLGQVTEIIAMLLLGALLGSWRLKWIFACGLGFGVLRFVLSAMNTRACLLAGITMHGFSYALILITAQIYLEQRIEAAWRARAQALLTLMSSGIGNLLGYLGTGWWFSSCSSAGGPRWSTFWGGLALVVGLVMAWFLAAYRGKGPGSHPANERGTSSA